MFTAYSFNVRKAGTSFEEYKTHLETKHVPLLTRLIGDIGSWRYTRSYTPTEGPEAVFMMPQDSASSWVYDCITRLDFEDKETWQKFLAGFGANHKEIAEDEARFMDREKTRFVVVGEGCVSEGGAKRLD